MLEDGIYKVTRPTGETYLKEVNEGYVHWWLSGIQNPEEEIGCGWKYEKCVVMTEAELLEAANEQYQIGYDRGRADARIERLFPEG